MASIGHGISDAVRNHIPIWVDENAASMMFTTYQASGGVLSQDQFRVRIRDSKNWVRKSRRNTSSGFERLYRCKIVQKASLIVHSPETDMSANSYVFCIDEQPVAGGKTKLKSTHVSTAISKNDKTTGKPHEVHFIKLSQEEIDDMRVQMRMGDGFAQLELEREA